ncbi:hypothetical protein LOY52_09145 [Pseudomonas sp. B21-051]|nr:hypothetical protein [Pseudomonas sp. B21-051]UVK91078.1 hypothetical protein LOY52_09145 [Pseudomonas sp. B21-051]
MGRGWPTGADDVAWRRHPRLQLRRLRPGHCRTRRTRAHHPLRV